MISTQRIYGLDVNTKSWATMLYPDVLKLKAKLAYERIATLNKEYYMDKDSGNITDCVNAMRFNEELLKELK